MWVAPFVVGVGFSKLRGQTWTSSMIYSGAVTWTVVQVRKGALMRVASMGHRLMSLSAYNILAGVAIGMVGGVGVSQLLFGDEGRKDALDLYSGKVSVASYAETLSKVPSRAAAINIGNRAVEGNAAGLPAGTNIATLAYQERARIAGAPSQEYLSQYTPEQQALYLEQGYL
jgi:hypothetical protein